MKEGEVDLSESIFFNILDPQNCFQVNEVISKKESCAKPSKCDKSTDSESTLKRVLREVWGRTKLVDAEASLSEYLYKIPVKQASVR